MLNREVEVTLVLKINDPVYNLVSLENREGKEHLPKSYRKSQFSGAVATALYIGK